MNFSDNQVPVTWVQTCAVVNPLHQDIGILRSFTHKIEQVGISPILQQVQFCLLMYPLDIGPRVQIKA